MSGYFVCREFCTRGQQVGVNFLVRLLGDTWVLLCLEIEWMISSIICNAELVLLGRMRYIWRRGEIMLVLFRAS